jgi:hypothetical protein
MPPDTFFDLPIPVCGIRSTTGCQTLLSIGGTHFCVMQHQRCFLKRQFKANSLGKRNVEEISILKKIRQSVYRCPQRLHIRCPFFQASGPTTL